MPNLKATTPTVAKPAPKAKAAPKAKPQAKAAAAPKTDAKPDAQALAKRIATERQTAASIFSQASAASVSIPVKPLSAYLRSYKRDVTAHPIERKPSPRQAAALAVAAAAHGVTVADKATFSRKFEMRGAQYAIENGALSDAIASGLCTYDSKAETVTLTNAAELASQCGSKAIRI